MTAKESSVRSLGRVPAERPDRGAFQNSSCEGFLSFGWEQELVEARWRLLSVQSRCCSRLMICLGLRSSKLCGWFIALFLPTRIFGRQRHGIQHNTPCCVLWVHAWNIYSLYCWCSNQPSDSTPPLPFMCDACESSSSSPGVLFFCQALIKGLQVSQYVRAV